MMYTEFNNMMIERFGWSFPEEIYRGVVEPVYMAVREDKSAFVDYCGDKDLNGLEMLARDISTVMQMASQGHDIYAIHEEFIKQRIQVYKDKTESNTLTISEMKVRLEDYLTDMSKDAVENVNLFADIAEDERLPDTIRCEAEEQCTYHRSRVTTYASLIVELRSGDMDHIFSR